MNRSCRQPFRASASDSRTVTSCLERRGHTLVVHVRGGCTEYASIAR
jgi:hypothetical protein